MSFEGDSGDATEDAPATRAAPEEEELDDLTSSDSSSSTSSSEEEEELSSLDKARIRIRVCFHDSENLMLII